MRQRVSLITVVVILAAVTGSVGAAAGTAPLDHGTSDCEFPVTATDATGEEVTVESEPQRVVTLNPSAAQTMWEIGGRDKVLGVSQYATYLDGATEKANVSGSGPSSINIERVVDLEPDLVLAPNTIQNETIDALREAGLTVYRFSLQTSIDDIKHKTLLTGQLTGQCEGAEETVDWMEAELNTVEEAIQGRDRPRVLYVFFGYTGGTGTFAHAVIETAGGTNIAAAANISGYQPISDEVVVDRDPEWIVVNDGAPQVPQSAAYNGTTAVQNDQIVVLQEEYISQPAPRIVRSVKKLAQTLHPEAYEAVANGTATDDGTTAAGESTSSPMTDDGTSANDGTTVAGESTPSPTAENTPGFGIGVAAIALAATILLFRRFDR